LIKVKLRHLTGELQPLTIQPEQNGPRNWTMVLLGFVSTAVSPEAHGFSSYSQAWQSIKARGLSPAHLIRGIVDTNV
jgi:hypothetical protein